MPEQIDVNFYLAGSSTPYDDAREPVEGDVIENSDNALHDIGKCIAEILGNYDNFNEALISEFPYMQNRGQSVKIV